MRTTSSPLGYNRRAAALSELKGPAETNWYEDHQKLASVARHMAEEGGTPAEIVYMLEKPWKFTDEWRGSQAIDEAIRIVESAVQPGTEQR
jgi:hypothetical protein